MTDPVVLSRLLTKETVSVEPFLSLDGQGKPSYGTPVDIDARVKREDKEAIAADGSKIRTALTLWILPDEEVFPDEYDRIEFDGETFIGAVVKDVKNRASQVVHRRLHCRRE